MSALDALMGRIGHRFRDPELLRLAMTHPSRRNESALDADNARLEFLGDAVLRLAVAQILFDRHPDLDEARLTEWTRAAVSAGPVSRVGIALGLDDVLDLGVGERANTGGRNKRMEDATEALLGAVFVDGGFAAARERVAMWFRGPLEAPPEVVPDDPKGALQAMLQKRVGNPKPVYEVAPAPSEDGGARFAATVHDEKGTLLGRGEGANKKDAEKAAARDALTRGLAP